MGLSFYHIPRFQTPTPWATRLNTPQTVTFQPLKLGNIKRFWKKLLESGTWRITKILEQPIQYWQMVLSFYYIPRSLNHPSTHTDTHTHTPRYHSNSHNLISGAGVKGPLKKLIESEKIRKTLRIPTNGSSIVPYKKVLKGR